jgi:hypothetical protein
MAADGKRTSGLQAAAICAVLMTLRLLLGEDAARPRAGVHARSDLRKQ